MITTWLCTSLALTIVSLWGMKIALDMSTKPNARSEDGSGLFTFCIIVLLSCWLGWPNFARVDRDIPEEEVKITNVHNTSTYVSFQVPDKNAEYIWTKREAKYVNLPFKVVKQYQETLYGLDLINYEVVFEDESLNEKL